MTDQTRGLAWIALGGLLFVGFMVLVRQVSLSLHPVQAAFIRYAMGLLLIAPLFLRRGTALFASERVGGHAVRGVLHGFGVLLWFYAIARLPLADVTALGFTAPVYVLLGAWLFLGEKLTSVRIASVVLGLCGVMLILRPGYAPIGMASAAMLLAAPLFAVSKLLTKSLVKRDNSETVIAFLGVFCTLTMLPFAIMVWQPPEPWQLLVLFGTAVFATASHWCVAQGLSTVDVTAAQPVEFLQLVWSALIGYTLFAEEPSLMVLLGATLVVASATWVAHHESRPAPQSTA